MPMYISGVNFSIFFRREKRRGSGIHFSGEGGVSRKKRKRDRVEWGEGGMCFSDQFFHG